MIAFIDEHRAVYGVEPICKVLPIAPSIYHAHAARRDQRPLRSHPPARALAKLRIVCGGATLDMLEGSEIRLIFAH